MDVLEAIFWVFFGATGLWVAWGFVRVFLLDRHQFPAPRATRHSAGGGSHAESVAGLGVIGSSESSVDLTGGTSSGDSSGGDSGGGDSGGGGDFSGGGGDSGGGGSSGGW